MQYLIIGVTPDGGVWRNKTAVVLVLLLLLPADEYAGYYTIRESGIDAASPTPWQAFKGFSVSSDRLSLLLVPFSSAIVAWKAMVPFWGSAAVLISKRRAIHFRGIYRC